MKTSVILMVVILVMMTGNRSQAREKVKLTNGEWPPYASRSLPGYGAMSRIVTRAFALSGIAVKYVFFDSWKRSYILAKQGEFDGSITWARTDEREKDFHYSDPVMPHEYVFFHLKSAPFDWKSLEDIKDRRISVTNAYHYGREFDTAVAMGRLRVYRVYADINNIQNLLKGRTDLFPMDKRTGYYLLETEYPPDVRIRVTHHPTVLERFTTGLVISRQITRGRAIRLIQAFNRGLSQLKKNGEYARLMSGLAH